MLSRDSFIWYLLLDLASTLYVAYALRDGFCFLSNYSGCCKKGSVCETSVLSIAFTEFVKYNRGFYKSHLIKSFVQ